VPWWCTGKEGREDGSEQMVVLVSGGVDGWYHGVRVEDELWWGSTARDKQLPDQDVIHVANVLCTLQTLCSLLVIEQLPGTPSTLSLIIPIFWAG